MKKNPGVLVNNVVKLTAKNTDISEACVLYKCKEFKENNNWEHSVGIFKLKAVCHGRNVAVVHQTRLEGEDYMENTWSLKYCDEPFHN